MKSIKVFISEFKKNIIFYQKLLKDPRTPKISKILLGMAVAYALTPVDLIPDFVPVLGHLDDVIIIGALVVVAMRLVPVSLREEIKNNLTGS